MSCEFCKPTDDNRFVPLNNTVGYSGIEISMHQKGMLRCRYYENENLFETQDVINIKFCPVCGEKLKNI